MLAVDRETGDDWCHPITNLRPLRIFRYRDHTPHTDYL